MCKSLEQVKRDVGRYVKLKDLKLPKLSYICKLYRKLFLNWKQSTGNKAVKTGFLWEGKK